MDSYDFDACVVGAGAVGFSMVPMSRPDFRLDGPSVHGLDGLVALSGIESPGLTSSLAIGEAAADLLDRG